MRDLNPKVAADSQGTFRFKCPFLLMLVLSAIFNTFLKIKTSNKSIRLRMNPPTHSASYKKIHTFLKSLVDGHFYIVYFSL
jgi:hypothetical protein